LFIKIITINYKNYGVTKKLINSFIREFDTQNSELIVVDNESNEIEFEDLKNSYKTRENIKFISFINNYGYFGAAFKAIKKLYIDLEDNEFLIICNNDIIFNDFKWMQELNPDYFKKNKIGLIGPFIESSDKSNSNPFMKIRPTKSTYLIWRAIFSFFHLTRTIYYIKKFLKKDKIQTISKKSLQIEYVYAVHGSCIIFTKYFFDSRFDWIDKPFLYAEEICVAEHCIQNNLNVISNPNLKIKHNEHLTIGDQMTKEKFRYISSAQKYILSKYY
jgi:hypothetical protein